MDLSINRSKNIALSGFLQAAIAITAGCQCTEAMTFHAGLRDGEDPGPLFHAISASCSSAFSACLKHHYSPAQNANLVDYRQITDRTKQLPVTSWNLLSPEDFFNIGKKIHGAIIYESRPGNKPQFVSRLSCITIVPQFSNLTLTALMQREFQSSAGLIALLDNKIVLLLGGNFTDGPESNEELQLLKLRYFDPTEAGPTRIKTMPGSIAMRSLKAMWIVRMPDATLPLYVEDAAHNSYF